MQRIPFTHWNASAFYTAVRPIEDKIYSWGPSRRKMLRGFYFPAHAMSVYVDKKSADTDFGNFPLCLRLAIDCFPAANHRV